MAVPQPGIFAQGTRSHYHLEFDLRPDADNEQICAAIGGREEPSVTVGGVEHRRRLRRRPARRLIPDDIRPTCRRSRACTVRPAACRRRRTTSGCGRTAPARTSSSTSPAPSACFAPVASLGAEQPGFVYQDSRDLTGFIDGTENPPVEKAHDVAIVEHGPGAGGSHVITARFVHDLAKFHT